MRHERSREKKYSAPGNKKRSEARPPHFQIPEEAGQFWDSHDSADYGKQMIVAECEIDIQRKTYLIPLDSDLYRKVQSIAREKGISTETLLTK
jgi:hypothetical protein